MSKAEEDEGQPAVQVVGRFWAAMNTNDFRLASRLLDPGFVLEWPQSGERICGRENFVAINENYPAAEPWRFTVNRLVAGEEVVASDITVTDGAITARAITFSEVRGGLITRQVEYWPEPFEAPAWRAQWVERAK